MSLLLRLARQARRRANTVDLYIISYRAKRGIGRMLTRTLYWFLKSRPYRKRAVRYKNHVISAEIADSFAKQMIGLMYRKGIGKNEGMLFPLIVGGKNRAAVIMLNMKFGIDIVWMNEKHMIVDIAKNAKQSSIFGRPYVPKKEAKYVLELKRGTAERMGIRTGERMSF